MVQKCGVTSPYQYLVISFFNKHHLFDNRIGMQIVLYLCYISFAENTEIFIVPADIAGLYLFIRFNLYCLDGILHQAVGRHTYTYGIGVQSVEKIDRRCSVTCLDDILVLIRRHYLLIEIQAVIPLLEEKTGIIPQEDAFCLYMHIRGTPPTNET